MDINNLTPEQLTAARAASSSAELLDLAGKNGITLTDHEAAAAFSTLHASGELADDELDAVSGGACFTDSSDATGVTAAATVSAVQGVTCPKCGSSNIGTVRYNAKGDLKRYKCQDCGHPFGSRLIISMS